MDDLIVAELERAGASHIDDIVRALDVPAHEVSGALLMLELAGRVQSNGAMTYRLTGAKAGAVAFDGPALETRENRAKASAPRPDGRKRDRTGPRGPNPAPDFYELDGALPAPDSPAYAGEDVRTIESAARRWARARIANLRADGSIV